MIRLFTVFFCCIGFVFAGPVNKPMPKPLPSQTPLSGCHVNADGVESFLLPDGKEVFNIFEIASQAMSGKVSCIIYKNNDQGLLPRSIQGGEISGGHEIAALNWLIKNAKKKKNGALVWTYDFDNAYNDVVIKKPWTSAFGQAHVVRAFTYAYEKTNNPLYREYALGAAKAYDLLISEGGFKAELPDGSVFFEEVPSQPLSHILNGHLISVIALLESGKTLNDSSLLELGSKGLATTKKYLPLYDVGYWSRYDLNPKKQEILFRFRLTQNDKTADPILFVNKIELVNPITYNSIVLDVGSSDDAVGAWRISGLDWGQSVIAHGREGRDVIDGRLKRKTVVPGGSRENSYFILPLPDYGKIDFVELPKHKIKVVYFDNGVGKFNLQVQDINHGNFLRFADIAGTETYLKNSQKWVTATYDIPISYFAWYMGPAYQKYHAELLNTLYKMTGDHFFAKYSTTWKGYLNNHDDSKPGD